MFEIDNLYYDDIQREYSMLEQALDITVKKADIAYEYVSNMSNVSIMEADLNIMGESGDYNDLAHLYEDATAQAGEKKKGIIVTIIEGIGKFISGLLEKLTGKVSDKKLEELANDPDAPKQIKVKKDPNKFLKMGADMLNGIMDKIKPGFTSKDEDGNKKFDFVRTLITGTEALAVAGGAYLGVKNAPNIKKGFTSLIDKGKDIINNLKGRLKSAKDETEIEVINAATHATQNAIKCIGQNMTDIFIAPFMGNVIDAEFKEVNTEEDQKSGKDKKGADKGDGKQLPAEQEYKTYNGGRQGELPHKKQKGLPGPGQTARDKARPNEMVGGIVYADGAKRKKPDALPGPGQTARDKARPNEMVGGIVYGDGPTNSSKYREGKRKLANRNNRRKHRKGEMNMDESALDIFDEFSSYLDDYEYESVYDDYETDTYSDDYEYESVYDDYDNYLN